MSNPWKPNSLVDYLAALFLVVLFFAGFVFFWKFAAVSTTPKVEKIIVRAPECQDTFESYKDLVARGQFVHLLENAGSYASRGKFVRDYEVTLSRSGEDEIACGYLYVRAAKNGQPLDEKLDSIYVSPNGLGGHLLRSRGIQITTSIPNTTEALLRLNAIPFLPTIPYRPDAQNFRVANWAKLLNVTNLITFNIGLSTQDPGGIIQELTVAYKCWSLTTGEETQGCQLGVVEVK